VDAGLAAYRAALAIREQLAAGDAGNVRWQREIALGHAEIGDILRRQGQWGPALDAYRAAVTTWENLAAAAPSDQQLQQDLLMGDQRVGDMLLKQEDYAASSCRGK
jgi:hypothetical protein